MGTSIILLTAILILALLFVEKADSMIHIGKADSMIHIGPVARGFLLILIIIIISIIIATQI
jgi:hypothetical protein